MNENYQIYDIFDYDTHLQMIDEYRLNNGICHDFRDNLGYQMVVDYINNYHMNLRIYIPTYLTFLPMMKFQSYKLYTNSDVVFQFDNNGEMTVKRDSNAINIIHKDFSAFMNGYSNKQKMPLQCMPKVIYDFITHLNLELYNVQNHYELLGTLDSFIDIIECNMNDKVCLLFSDTIRDKPIIDKYSLKYHIEYLIKNETINVTKQSGKIIYGHIMDVIGTMIIGVIIGLFACIIYTILNSPDFGFCLNVLEDSFAVCCYKYLDKQLHLLAQDFVPIFGLSVWE